MIKNVTVGSDSEVIVADLSGRPFPVCGIIGGTKDKPRKLGSSPYLIQEDNVLLEFNIPVCTSAKEFADHMLLGLRKSLHELPPSLMAYPHSTAEFAPQLLSFPAAQVFGCEPDFNAWTMEENPKPYSDNKQLRSAAGHIHIGWENPTNQDRLDLVKACDIFAGLRSVINFKDKTRRQLYGKAGAFRPKEYGIEHRVLDNEWVLLGVASTIWYWYQDAINFVNAGLMQQVSEEDSTAIQKAINTYDKDSAYLLLKKFVNMLHNKGITDADLKANVVSKPKSLYEMSANGNLANVVQNGDTITMPTTATNT
jgi:hypothetical protein